MKHILLEHDCTASECSAALQLASCDDRPSLIVTICPFIAANVHASNFLLWEKLHANNLVQVAEHCQRNAEPSHRAFDLEIPHRKERSQSQQAFRLAKSLGLSQRVTQLAINLDLNRDRIRSFMNSLLGQTGLVIGTGPSLKRVDLRKYSKYPSISCNKIYLLDTMYRYRASHYILEDRLLLEDCASEIASYEAPVKWVPLDHMGLNSATCYFPLWRSYSPYPRFSSAIEDEAFTGWTVSYLMLQLAVFFGLTKIVLIGIDGTYNLPRSKITGPVRTSNEMDHNHFDQSYYGPGKRFHDPEPARVNAAYALAANVLSDRGVEVINCSEGSAIDCFPKRSIESVLGGSAWTSSR